MGLSAWIPLIWFFTFLVGPILYLVVLSLAKKGLYGGVDWVFQFSNYERVANQLYLEIFLRSFQMALLTTLFVLILGVPLAWSIATLKGAWKKICLFLVLAPFLMNLVVRVYSLKYLFSYDGPVQFLVRVFGFQLDQYQLSQNQYLVFWGMVTTYLPFAVFPLLVAFEKLNYDQIEACEDMGASSMMTLWKVILPQVRPALASGSLMVLVPSFGEFLIPDMLGGAKTMLAGNLITEQFLKNRDWPFGASLSVILILLLGLCAYFIHRWGRIRV